MRKSSHGFLKYGDDEDDDLGFRSAQVLHRVWRWLSRRDFGLWMFRPRGDYGVLSVSPRGGGGLESGISPVQLDGFCSD